jgi:hypothetical protein
MINKLFVALIVDKENKIGTLGETGFQFKLEYEQHHNRYNVYARKKCTLDFELTTICLQFDGQKGVWFIEKGLIYIEHNCIFSLASMYFRNYYLT